jgi:apolipoprotein N-acyltransferase
MRRRVTNTRRIGRAARKLKVDILASSIEEVPDLDPETTVLPVEPASPDWLNSVSLVLASGKFTQHYEKRRLAPFAEHLPLPQSWQGQLRRVRPFSRISRFTPGVEPAVFTTTGGQRFATLICYESMTPDMAAEMAPQVDFLVVVTNDAPFDHSQANEAHFRSATMRAVETGKPVLQAANTGVTGAISGDGRILLRTPPGLSGPSVQYLRP